MKSNIRSKLAAALCAFICLGLCACGENSGTSDENEKVDVAAESSLSESENDMKEEESAGESNSEQTEESDTEQVSESETGSESEDEAGEEIQDEPDAEAEPEIFTPVEGLSENYADLDNRSFAYDGVIFTLGESTLQDMVDAGIPFKENELNNIGNNINKNYETSRYNVEINDYVNMQFRFINITDTNITEGECLLSSVRWYSIYVPQPDYDDSINQKAKECISEASKHVCFSFPLTLNKAQLLENNSNNTSEDEHNISYIVDSEVYMGRSGYNFHFNKKTDQLEDISVSWLP